MQTLAHADRPRRHALGCSRAHTEINAASFTAGKRRQAGSTHAGPGYTAVGPAHVGQLSDGLR